VKGGLRETGDEIPLGFIWAWRSPQGAAGRKRSVATYSVTVVGVGAEVTAEREHAGPVAGGAEHQVDVAGARVVLAADQGDSLGPQFVIAAVDVLVAVVDQRGGVMLDLDGSIVNEAADAVGLLGKTRWPGGS
jgi:hypothetical protein